MNAQLMAPAHGGPLVLRSPGWLLVTGGLRLCGALALTALAASPDLGGGPAARAAIGLAAAAVLFLAVRTFLEGVFVEVDGILVRNTFSSRRLRWEQVEDVARRRRSPFLWIALRDGERVRVYGTAGSLARRERLASLLRAARPGAAR